MTQYPAQLRTKVSRACGATPGAPAHAVQSSVSAAKDALLQEAMETHGHAQPAEQTLPWVQCTSLSSGVAVVAGSWLNAQMAAWELLTSSCKPRCSHQHEQLSGLRTSRQGVLQLQEAQDGAVFCQNGSHRGGGHDALHQAILHAGGQHPAPSVQSYSTCRLATYEESSAFHEWLKTACLLEQSCQTAGHLAWAPCMCIPAAGPHTGTLVLKMRLSCCCVCTRALTAEWAMHL